jgi:hypothetical protein
MENDSGRDLTTAKQGPKRVRLSAATRTPTDDAVAPDCEPRSTVMTSTRDIRGTEVLSLRDELTCVRDERRDACDYKRALLW